jgi:predicted  nucleic acid-binding Zn-ribbon protein
MKKVLFLSFTVLALIFSSCSKKSSEIKALRAQNDSLMIVNVKNATELDEVLILFNEIEDNFSSIKSAENYLSVQSNVPGELTPSIKERVRSDMKLITDILNENKEKIADLESKLKKSTLKSAQFQLTLNKLRTELDQKTMTLVALNEELGRKNQQINELSANVTALSKDVQDLRVQSNTQQQTIDEQQKEINTVYYCFGTSKELKSQKILQGDQMTANFNKDFFIRIKDYNSLKVIPLSAKKGKLLSKHPNGSYEFAKDSNGQVELKILDPKNFWSLTKYLVIQVNV